MPTEELFGANHFLLEAAGVTAKDSFDFTATVQPQKVGLLLPSVQMAREEGRGSDTDSGHDKWIDVLSTDWGTAKPAAADGGSGLRSDGDLVHGVAQIDMGGDFIL